MPVGRLAAANEIAQAILFMASDAASFMNGSWSLWTALVGVGNISWRDPV